MTQEQLAELLDISKRQLQNYELGETIPWKHFQPLTRIFDRPLEWFLYGAESEADAREQRLVEAIEQVQGLVAKVDELIDIARELRGDPTQDRGEDPAPPAEPRSSHRETRRKRA